MPESRRATLTEQLRAYGEVLDRSADAASTTGSEAVDLARQPSGGPGRRSRGLAAAAALMVVFAIVAVAVLLGIDTSRDREPARSRLPRARLAKIYSYAAAINGEFRPDEVRASRVDTKRVCPSGVACSYPRMYVVEGRGRFECQSCGTPIPARGRHLRVVVNTTNLHVADYGKLFASANRITRRDSVRLPSTKRPTSIPVNTGTIRFTSNDNPPIRTVGGATLRVADSHGALVASQYVPPNGGYVIRLPAALSSKYWYEAVGARPACRIPLPIPSDVDNKTEIGFEVDCNHRLGPTTSVP